MSEKLQPYMKLGRIGIYRPDALNWVVEGPDKVAHYPTLAGAVKRAAFMAADTKAKDAQEWLYRFKQECDRLERLVKEVVKNQQDSRYFNNSSEVVEEMGTYEKSKPKVTRRIARKG